ncbi:hypothetical protein GDO78_018947 [Eleutherodactylus coqui]|uniref:Uncharacterized protein n=1 Tax=Eleutherodactylus coqui TaxID=57060 RepID=A0A8J6EIQ6_ELECQ|nr:hypothetical protein GDO78_018947 [Eleutherodactylus coqui]
MLRLLGTDDYEVGTRIKGITARAILTLALGAVGFLLLGFIIGWFAKSSGSSNPSQVSQSMRKEFWDELKAENIKHYLYNFSRVPHLAGTEENFLLAKQIQTQWKEYGLDQVELTHYDILLSYPNQSHPNYISIVDEKGQEARQTGQTVVHEKACWRPRRTMIFASWDAEEFGLMGSTEWAEENVKLLEHRAVAYINADSSVEGNYTLKIDCSPLLYQLVYSLTKEIPSPDEGFEGKSLYESWHQKYNWTDFKDAPRINKLGSGNDFEVFFQRLGIASGRARYTKSSKEHRYNGYPVYHSIYETSEIVDKFYDPLYKNHLVVAKVRGGLVFDLANEVIIPFNAQDYASELKNYADIVNNMGQKHKSQLDTYNVSFYALYSAIENFTKSATSFHSRLKDLDVKKHIIFAPSSHNKYVGESFPGIYDALFDIESKSDQRSAWDEVKRQISIATFTVQAAGQTLEDVL